MNGSRGQVQAGAGRRVARNTLLLSIGQVIQAGSMGLWTILVARYVGPDAFGVYAYAQSALAILIVIVGLGLDQLLTRDVAQRPEEGPRYLVTFAAIRATLLAMVLTGIFISIRHAGYSPTRSAITLLVSFNSAVMGLSSLVAAALSAHEAMGYVVMAQSANYVLTLAGGIVAIALHQPFSVLLALSLAASLVQLALGLAFAARLPPRPAGGWRASVLPARAILSLLNTALPFTMLQLISAFRTFAPPLLLEYLTHNDAAVGYYAAAQRVHLVTVIVPDMLLLAIFPAFSSSYARQPAQFGARFERAYRYVLLATVPLAFGMWLLAPPLLALLYGPQYAPAARTLQVLSLALLGGVGWVMGPAMLAMDRQTVSAAVYIATMALATALGVWAIPRYGAAGAAGAFVIGKLLQDLIYTRLLFRWLHVPFPLAWTGKTLAASFIMSALIAALAPRIHFLVVGLLLAPTVYVACHFGLHSLSPADWAYIRELLPEKARRLTPE